MDARGGWNRLAERWGVYEDALASNVGTGRRHVTGSLPRPSVVIVSCQHGRPWHVSFRGHPTGIARNVRGRQRLVGRRPHSSAEVPGAWRRTENRDRAANNQVLGECTGRYIVLLNPDTEATPDAFRRMAAWMDAIPPVGLAGPTVNNPDGSRQDTVSRSYPGQKRTAGELSGLPGEIACVMGACQIVRAELLRKLGGFERSSSLREDQDLCLRIRKEGYRIGHVDDAVILHHGGKSERGSPPADVWRKKAAAEYLFYRKHFRPETVLRIAHANVRGARRKLILARLALPFVRDRARMIAKLERYRVVYDVAIRETGKG
jgi:hypothetical protein